MESSRICVKNIPRSLTERQLHDHFSGFGNLTDVKLMHTKSGNSRGFGFIGFSNASDANKAVQYFHKTFIGSNRISVELAKKVGDPLLDRPWSKYSKGSSRYHEANPDEPRPPKRQKEEPKESTEDTDQELKEFLELMMPSKSVTSNKSVNSVSQSSNKESKDDFGTGRLFVRNLPYSTTEDDLIEAFSPFGELLEVHLVTDQQKHKSKGIAFIEFDDPTNAKLALQEMDGISFQGRLIHVLISHNKRVRSDHSITPESTSSFKREKEVRLKEQAGKRVSWNTLYMRPDTIMDAISELYQISKSDLMNRESSDLGARLALAETQIISKTKDDLELLGVDVEKLQEAAEASGSSARRLSVARSNDVILVKNLPYTSEEDELHQMFAKYGDVARFLMPSTKALAIVQFSHSSDAKKAFQNLAYKRYKSVPIYLEWAPKNIFKSSPPSIIHDQSMDSEANQQSSSIYVKNLSFLTTDEDLENHFDNVVSEVGGQLRSARVARRTHSNGTIVSAGFGFIEVDSYQVAKHVIQKLNGSILQGHIIKLRRSVRSHTPVRRNDLEESEPSLKLIVKNLAFECTKQDLMKLFSPFGQIKTCRIPKRFDGTHRGFAFIEFVTKQEARNAKERTNGVHLYGRRLNVEYANDVEQLDDI
eukprot:g9243.t1